MLLNYFFVPINLSGQIPVRCDCCQVYQETSLSRKVVDFLENFKAGWLSVEHFTPAGFCFGHPSSNQILLFSFPPTSTSKALTNDFMDLNLPTQQHKAWKCFLNVIETAQGLISFKIFKWKE